jgi:hypothetical protein
LPPVTGFYHASRWSGSAASWVDLNPAGASHSVAHGTDGTRQIGSIFFAADDWPAAVWSGTAASWIALPEIGLAPRDGYAIDGDQKVGAVDLSGGGLPHAILWNGSDPVVLHPAEFSSSAAVDVYQGRQVGVLYTCEGKICDSWQARLWHGSATAFEDLHAALPAHFTTSAAYGIWSDATTVYVVGKGDNSLTGRTEALMWTRPIAPCPADIDGNSNVNVNDLLSVISTWGQCPGCPPAHCPGDIAPIGPPQGDCQIDVNDLLSVITSWGWCP